MIQEYFQPKIGGKIRIFGLNLKKTTFLLKKSVADSVLPAFLIFEGFERNSILVVVYLAYDWVLNRGAGRDLKP